MADAIVSGLDSEVIAAAATQSQSITIGSQTVTRRSASDLIALDNHLASKRAAANGGGGWDSVRIALGVAPASTSDV